MHNLYKKTQEKIEQLKALVTAAYRREKEAGAADTSKCRFFLLNLKLVSLEFIFNLIKLMIIMTCDSGTVFKIFYQNNNVEACLFPYQTFKVIHKKIRIFSCAAIIIAVSAAVMTSFSSTTFGSK